MHTYFTNRDMEAPSGIPTVLWFKSLHVPMTLEALLLETMPLSTQLRCN